jgi:signal transduction histidine kinase
MHPNEEADNRAHDPRLEHVLEWALLETSAPVGFIALLPPARSPDAGSRESGGLRLVARHGLATARGGSDAATWPGGAGLLVRVTRTGEPAVVDDVAGEPDYVAAVPATRSLLAVPIYGAEHPLGVICLEDPRPAAFDAAALDFVAHLSRYAALALENARLHRAAEAAEHTMWDILDQIVHELKQPMTAVQGYARMLTLGIGGDLNETQQQFADVIAINAERMGSLVGELLDIARLEAGRLHLHLEAVELARLVEAVLAPLRASLEEKGQTLEVEVASSLPPAAGDRERLQRALGHLVRHAHQHTPPGERIQIRGWGEDGWVCLAVQEPESGTPTGEPERPLERLACDAEAPKDEKQLARTGLLAARAFARLHGGELRVEAAPGEGRRYTLVLPRAARAGR